MSRIEVIGQSGWLADAREEVAAAMRTSDEAWLRDMSLRWACRLAMVISDFGARIMLHADGVELIVEPNADVGATPFDPPIDADGRMVDSLSRAAWIKLSRLEEYSVAACEAGAQLAGGARCDPCLHCESALGAWRRMLYAANERSGRDADAYVGDVSRPLLQQFMAIAASVAEGRHFELTRAADYEDAWREFERFCADPRARPSTEWGRKYRRPRPEEIRIDRAAPALHEKRVPAFPANGIHGAPGASPRI
ncbi:hypothetical protein BVER_00324c [Candidatus Burkholderia verschuerenii]|uniref:Uncharacterized protein n=1 Tax=Candidatus Burkholderia verschuerenii TaxID=242163 RepID=A0A0L0M5U0_9BURK|nr:hypothetical protein [Candidatus Burkholderia verschuerenii]KND58027.1 hypothetical protein BVER_00324c [Candidatus Burkholderia verschuerenii]